MGKLSTPDTTLDAEDVAAGFNHERGIRKLHLSHPALTRAKLLRSSPLCGTRWPSTQLGTRWISKDLVANIVFTLVLVEQGQREEERKVLTDRHVHLYSDIRPHHVHTAHPQQCYISPRCLLSTLCTAVAPALHTVHWRRDPTRELSPHHMTHWLSAARAIASSAMAALCPSLVWDFHFCTTLKNRSRDEPLVSKGSISFTNLW